MKGLTANEILRFRRLVHQSDAVTANARCHALHQYHNAIGRLEQSVLLHRQRRDEEGWIIAMLALDSAVSAYDKEFAAPEDDER